MQDKKQQTTDKDYAYWVKLASRCSVYVAVILLISKTYAWLLSDSSAMLSSLTDSLLDVFASVMNFVILRYALMPADDDHKFGHGKAESLAGLVQASFVVGSSVLLLLHGIARTLNPIAVSYSDVTIAVSIFAIVLTLALVILQLVVISKTQSVAIQADHLHYKSDLLLNTGVIIAVLLSSQYWPGFDGAFTILVALYLGGSAIKIAMQSVHHLMDKALPDGEVAAMLDHVTTHPLVHGVHDVRTRQSGAIKFIQFHIELNDNLSLQQAHAISEEVEQRLKHEFADLEVFIHQDPLSVVASNVAGSENTDKM